MIGGTHGLGLAAVKPRIDGGAEVLLTGRDTGNLEAARRALGPEALAVGSDAASMADIDALGPLVQDRLGAIAGSAATI